MIVNRFRYGLLTLGAQTSEWVSATRVSDRQMGWPLRSHWLARRQPHPTQLHRSGPWHSAAQPSARAGLYRCQYRAGGLPVRSGVSVMPAQAPSTQASVQTFMAVRSCWIVNCLNRNMGVFSSTDRFLCHPDRSAGAVRMTKNDKALFQSTFKLSHQVNILGISGSLRPGSTNAQVLQAISRLLPATARLTLFEGLDDLPHFSPERDTENVLPAVQALREAIEQAKAVVICTPEYAFGIPGVLKNALDWCVSTVLFDQKPVAAISASPGFAGGERAMASLLPTLTALNTRIPDGCSLVLSSIRNKIDANGQLTDASTEQALQRLVDELLAIA